MSTPVIQLHLESAAAPRQREPITCGVPWPRGVLHDPGTITLVDGSGRRLPVQTRTLDRWSDGSVRWLLVDWQADVQQGSCYLLERRRQGREDPLIAPECPVVPTLVEDAECSVLTGALEMTIRRGSDVFLTLEAPRDPAGEPRVCAIELQAEDDHQTRYRARIDRLELEDSGPLRASVRAWGAMLDSRGRHLVDLLARIETFAGSPVVRIQLTVRNPRPAGHPHGKWGLGSRGSVYFRDLSLGVVPGLTPTSAVVSCSPGPGAPCARVELPLELYQDSSGGEQWDSRNHLNRDGRLTVRFSGYRLRAGDDENKGRRAGPVVVLDGEHGTLALTMRHFWQNFPKAVEASRAGLTLRLFPRQHAELHELQGGEQKTHCFALSLGRDRVSEIPLDWCRLPALPILSPEWHAECQSVPHLVPQSQDSDRDLCPPGAIGDRRRRHLRDET